MRSFSGKAIFGARTTSSSFGLLVEAVAKRRKVLGESHPYTGSSRSELALLFQRQGRYDDAEREFLAAASILHVGPQVPASLRPVTVAGSRFDRAARIAALYDEWGKPDKAAEWRETPMR